MIEDVTISNSPFQLIPLGKENHLHKNLLIEKWG
jgi:hypothetical protein